MKLIISILLFPSFLAILLAWGCYSFYRYGMAQALSSEFTSSAHLLKAFMYMAMGTGIPLAMFSALTGAVLTLCSFIFKSWTRAVFSMGIAGSGGYIWYYFLQTAFPD